MTSFQERLTFETGALNLNELDRAETIWLTQKSAVGIILTRQVEALVADGYAAPGQFDFPVDPQSVKNVIGDNLIAAHIKSLLRDESEVSIHLSSNQGTILVNMTVTGIGTIGFLSQDNASGWDLAAAGSDRFEELAAIINGPTIKLLDKCAIAQGLISAAGQSHTLHTNTVSTS